LYSHVFASLAKRGFWRDIRAPTARAVKERDHHGASRFLAEIVASAVCCPFAPQGCVRAFASLT
jgi:hypothetical protein